MKVVQEHKGHQFVMQTFNVVTVCEQCDKQVVVLTPGMVCNGGQVYCMCVYILYIGFTHFLPHTSVVAGKDLPL